MTNTYVYVAYMWKHQQLWNESEALVQVDQMAKADRKRRDFSWGLKVDTL